jgi:hypothetical protein
MNVPQFGGMAAGQQFGMTMPGGGGMSAMSGQTSMGMGGGMMPQQGMNYANTPMQQQQQGMSMSMPSFSGQSMQQQGGMGMSSMAFQGMGLGGSMPGFSTMPVQQQMGMQGPSMGMQGQSMSGMMNMPTNFGGTSSQMQGGQTDQIVQQLRMSAGSMDIKVSQIRCKFPCCLGLLVNEEEHAFIVLDQLHFLLYSAKCDELAQMNAGQRSPAAGSTTVSDAFKTALLQRLRMQIGMCC